MKAIGVIPAVLVVFSVCLSSYASNVSCIDAPRHLIWGKAGSANVTLCGYQNGNVNTSYIQITNIPRQTKNGCLTIEYQSASNKPLPNDSLTVAPNEGVIVADSREPTTLKLDNADAAKTTSLSVKTDNISEDKYGISVSAQSSSVDVNVKINWQRSSTCGS